MQPELWKAVKARASELGVAPSSLVRDLADLGLRWSLDRGKRKLSVLHGILEQEERLDVLEARMEAAGMNKADYWWYTDLRRFGSVPHAGFGLGFERTVQFVTGMTNIRDVIPFPRTPRSAEF